MFFFPLHRCDIFLSSIWYRLWWHIITSSFVFIFSFKTLDACDRIYTCIPFSSLRSVCSLCVYVCDVPNKIERNIICKQSPKIRYSRICISFLPQVTLILRIRWPFSERQKNVTVHYERKYWSRFRNSYSISNIVDQQTIHFAFLQGFLKELLATETKSSSSTWSTVLFIIRNCCMIHQYMIVVFVVSFVLLQVVFQEDMSMSIINNSSWYI